MGHRFESLTLPPHLAAWSEAGIEFVHKDLLAGTAMAGAAQEEQAPPFASDATTSAHQVQSLAGASEPARLAGDQAIEPPRSEPGARASGSGLGAEPDISQSGPVTQPDEPIGYSHMDKPTEAEPEWSGPFAVALERRKPVTRVLWTYWELALDFGDEPSPARRMLCASILKHLPCKEVTSFWPLSERQGTTMVARPGLFWQGLRMFGASHVLCFGRRASMTLFPDRPYAHGLMRHGQLNVIILPGFEDMLPDNRQAKALAWELLKDLSV